MRVGWPGVDAFIDKNSSTVPLTKNVTWIWARFTNRLPCCGQYCTFWKIHICKIALHCIPWKCWEVCWPSVRLSLLVWNCDILSPLLSDSLSDIKVSWAATRANDYVFASPNSTYSRFSHYHLYNRFATTTCTTDSYHTMTFILL